MKEILFVTGNKGKISSANRCFADYDINASIADINTIEPEINDLEIIAIEKVKRAYDVFNKPCIANDSGFYIEGYPYEKDFPGAFINRHLLNTIGIKGLINDMNGINNRKCYFKEILAYYDGNTLKLFDSYSMGLLDTEVRENDLDDQWSPLWRVFIPEGYNVTLSELTSQERAKRSNENNSPFIKFAKWYSNVYEKKL